MALERHMGERGRSPVERRVVDDYYRTTSARSAAPDAMSHRRSADGLRRRLRPWIEVTDKDVLDLGSGTGELCRLLKDGRARSVIGVNLSQEEIDFAKGHVTVDFVCQDVAQYLDGRENSSTDVIYALNLLEHLDKDTVVTVLEHAHRVLRPGGQLVAMVPNATSPFGGMTRYWDVTHQIAFTPTSVRQLAVLVGFTGWEFRECGPVPYGFVSTIRYALWQGIRFLIWLYLNIELASGKGGIYTADMLFRLTKASRVPV